MLWPNKVILNAYVESYIVLDAKKNLINQHYVKKLKNGSKLLINKKITNNGWKSIHGSARHVNKLFKNILDAIILSVYADNNFVLIAILNGIKLINLLHNIAWNRRQLIQYSFKRINLILKN